MPRFPPRPRSIAVAALVAGFVILGVSAEWRIMLGSDPAWLLYVAGRVLDGAELYKDVLEPNPPLIVWLNVPVVWLANRAGLTVVSMFRIVISAMVFGTIVLALRPAWRSRVLPAPLLLVLLVLVLHTIPLTAFGEREHIVLILLVPYLVSAVRRAAGEAVSPWLAAIAGLFAGLAVALKPPYALVCPLTSLLAFARSPKPLRAVWPEVWLAALILVSYVALIIAFAPAYAEMLRTWGPLYWRYRHATLADTLAGRPMALAIWATLLLYLLFRRGIRYGHLADVLALAIVGFIVGIGIQRKGFDYHFFPPMACSVLLLGVLALPNGRQGTRTWCVGRQLLASALGMAIITPMVANAWRRSTVRIPPSRAAYDVLVSSPNFGTLFL